mmetsp:Transcript_55584/g.63469  ORF Transcript_55584/g.63469 Transcript_55584/m.63469 type:complete len:178 (+) Transcript_55584:43-576(+)
MLDQSNYSGDEGRQETTLHTAEDTSESLHLQKPNVLPNPFKDLFTFSQRLIEYRQVKAQYPDLLPVCCEMIETAEMKEKCGKMYYLRYYVSKLLLSGTLCKVIQHTINEDKADILIGHNQRILLFNNAKTAMADTKTIEELYAESAEEDGWLYFKFFFASVNPPTVETKGNSTLTLT